MQEHKCPRCRGKGKVTLTGVEILGINVARIREQKRFTQQELSDLIPGMSRGQVANVETARSGTTTDNMVPLADALGVTTDELLRYHDDTELLT